MAGINLWKKYINYFLQYEVQKQTSWMEEDHYYTNFKKSDKNKPENYRGINFSCTTFKLFIIIVSNYIINNLEINYEQQEFRKGRSCRPTDAKFILKLMEAIIWETT